jgi:hypothetical protein
MTDDAILIPGYLHTVCDLVQSSEDKRLALIFDQYMVEAMPEFTDSPWPGWALFLAATRTAWPGIHPKQYLHIWRVPDYHSLSYLMTERLTDNVPYNRLDVLIGNEARNFTKRLDYDPQSLDPDFEPPKTSEIYLRVCIRLVQDPSKQIDHDQIMGPICQHPLNNWSFIHGAHAQNGVLRSRYYLWAACSYAVGDESVVLEALEDNKPLMDTVVAGSLSCDLWEPKVYRPSA